jgi:precorrin-2 dehydrogenase/sirohydrochlorin ferrochelatase
VGERKAQALLDTGAFVTVVSPDLTDSLKTLRDNGKITHVSRTYQPGDLDGAWIAIAATSSEDVNRTVALDAQGLVNVADSPELCNFFVPSTVKRGDLVVAISTEGGSPAMSKTIRQELEALYDLEFAKYLNLVRCIRTRAKLAIPSRKARQALFQKIASPDMLKLLRTSGYRQAARLAVRWYRETNKGAM